MEIIRNYFNAEKYESVLFVLVGLTAITLVVYFLFFQKDTFYIGMAYPIIAVALLQIVVGGSVWIRSRKDIERIEQFLQNSPEQISKVEIPRMKVVMRNFLIYRYVEIALLLFGLFVMFYYPENSFVKGLGIGLFMEAALMLSLDFFPKGEAPNILNFSFR